MPFEKGHKFGRVFQKGQSGNPKGRPRVGDSLAEVIRLRWNPVLRAKAIVALAMKAAEGDEKAFEVLAKRGWPEEAKGEIFLGGEGAPRLVISWQQAST